MKRWLRVCLLAVLAVGLFFIIRRELGVRVGGSDAGDAARIAGIPPSPPSQTLQPILPGAEPPDGLPEEAAPPSLPEAEPPASQPEEAAVTALEDVDLEALRAVNGDVVGWIMIPGTEISYPLMQGTDNEYYLNHTWRRRYSTGGSIFLECQNDPSLEGFHTLIYGHRMSDGSMFGGLKYYSDPDFWREHPSVYIVSDAGISRYDIFAAQEAGVTEIVYYLDLTGREEDFIRFCIDRSVIDTGIEPGPEDRFITLSTCASQGYETRWTVQAVLRQEEFESGPSSEAR